VPGRAAAAPGSATPELDSTHMNGLIDDKKRSVVPTAQSMSVCVCVCVICAILRRTQIKPRHVSNRLLRPSHGCACSRPAHSTVCSSAAASARPTSRTARHFGQFIVIGQNTAIGRVRPSLSFEQADL